MSEILLKLKNINASYTDLKILDDISFEIFDNEILAIIGPNGAGKSTVIKTIFGITKITQGEVFLYGNKIYPVSYKMLERGISYIPQSKQLFPRMTVRENLEMGGYIIKNQQQLKKRILEVLEIFPVLKDKLSELALDLSGGQQQMLTIARGLICKPKIILLDEPTIGLSPRLSKEVFNKIKEIREKEKVSIVIIEHNIESVLDIADRVCVLEYGKIVFQGKRVELTKEILEKVFLRN